MQLNPSSAYLLVSHGSRDPRPQLAVESLAQLLRSWQQRDSIESAAGAVGLLTHCQVTAPPIETACLELAPQPLHEQIRQVGNRAMALGYRRLVILPLFLLAGVHVRTDLPAEVEQAQQALGSAIDLHLCPYLGSASGIETLLSRMFAQSPTGDRILLAHGSRRPCANREVAQLAARLQAAPAYWSVAPSLADQVSTVAAAGCSRIAIVPYFLFAGGITEAIAQTVADLSASFPDCQLLLSDPIGATPELAALAIDLLEHT